MNWEGVGSWLKDNAGTGAALVGSLLTGNLPGAVAAGVSLVSSATGTTDPAAALTQLQSDPATMLRLKELAFENEKSIREHLEIMTRLELEDKQHEHATTQKTIQIGDTSLDEYVRRTRPTIARQSWYGTLAYCGGCLLYRMASTGNINLFSIELAGIIVAPAMLYLGARTLDKRNEALGVAMFEKGQKP